MKNWKLYKNALIPTTNPTENQDISAIQDGSIWKSYDSEPLFARWTSDFDCGYETNWWYVIKDTPFDISALKSRKRTKIKKGMKYFDVKVVDPLEYKEELLNVTIAAYSAYPAKYRPTVNREDFLAREIYTWQKLVVIAAFFRETNELVGYGLMNNCFDNYVDLMTLRSTPSYEKHFINAAMMEGILNHYQKFLENGGIFSDGARNILHETAFQDYLEDLFLFRKAYCKLHLAYNPKIKTFVKILYPFRKILRLFDSIGLVHKVNGLLNMEELCRSEKTT